MNATAVNCAFLLEAVAPSRTTAGAAGSQAALATRWIRTYIVCAARMPRIAVTKMLAAVLMRVRDYAPRCDAQGERQSVLRTTSVIIELPHLGAAAEIVVLPTGGATGRLRCEQWRLPWELVRRGVDVLLCLGNVMGAMPEIIGNAALVFDPADPADIGNALRRLLTDPALRGEMRRRAVERARTFMSPEAVARATLDAVLVAARTGQR